MAIDSKTLKEKRETMEKLAAVNLEKGMTPQKALSEAGFKAPTKEYADKLIEGIKVKFNVGIQHAYEKVGLTPEFIAQKQKDILDNEDIRPADKLKAIDQVLQVVGGYAPKQVDVTTVTFEQAIIEITNKVDILSLNAKSVRKMLDITDAELVT